MRRFALVLLSCSTILFACFAGVLGGYVGGRLGNSPLSELTGSIINQDIRVTNQQEAVIDVVNKASSSVVSIVVSKDVPVLENYDPFLEYFGIPRNDSDSATTEKREVAAGTGFVISEDGMIITNRHVVEDDSAEYTVIFKDDTKYTAKVLARDTLLDIAFIKIEATGLAPLAFGSSKDLQVGQTVVAIGNALGEFSNTVSSGIVSGIGRNIVATDALGQNAEQLFDVIQTDASINSGNSGGPLLDLDGNVIGVNVAVASNAQGIGFAIPSDIVVDLLSRLSAEGEIVRPKLGVRFRMITQELKEANELSVDQGALIVRGETADDLAVMPGSSADRAGLRENDIILEVEGIKLTQSRPLNVVIQGFKVGDEVTLKVLRQGQEIEITAVLQK
ncbi:putative serine protease PepD [Patescibacteria group bacterium]|nr:trypsin-like peptidase domain-containing protein [Candidatus Dojkabacteria bacterium]CAG1022925.1 putative serine protease PepD [Patescibacteria group bacterium]